MVFKELFYFLEKEKNKGKKESKSGEESYDSEIDLIIRSYKLLFPLKKQKRKIKVTFNNKLKDYDCRVYYNNYYVNFHLSKDWQDIDDNIKIGLYQSMWLKILKKRLDKCDNKNKTYLDLYHNFIKSIGEFREKKYVDKELLNYFNEINDRYFYGMLDIPNLRWRKFSKNRFGYYNYTKDTITINSLLKCYPELVKYVLYHELLHKKYKYNVSKDGRTRHHTKKFRKAEKSYPKAEFYEKLLEKFAKYGKIE